MANQFDASNPATWAASAASVAGAEGQPNPYAEWTAQNRSLCHTVDEINEIVDCFEDIVEAATEDVDAADVGALVLEAFQALPVAPSTIEHQPRGTWSLVNTDFIVFTDRTEQVLGTEILGVPVSFELEPVHWTWDFGDGSAPLPTSDPGAGYPNQTVTHLYTAASEGVTVTLTTLWSGRYRLNVAGPWHPVNGFVTTTAAAGPFEIVEVDTRLIP